MGLLFVMTLCGVSLTLAHEITLVGPIHGFALAFGSSYGLSHADRAVLRQGFDCDTGDVRVPLTEASGTVRPLDAPPIARDEWLPHAHPHAPKVSLHVLNSILLI